MKDPKNILIVDDSKLSRISLINMLDGFDCKILEASDGFEALDIIKSDSPDLVFLDLLMPNLDGIGVLERLREDEVSIPVVVVSADIQNTTRDLCFKLGAADFLNKPMEPEAIRNVFNNFFQV